MAVRLEEIENDIELTPVPLDPEYTKKALDEQGNKSYPSEIDDSPELCSQYDLLSSLEGRVQMLKQGLLSGQSISVKDFQELSGGVGRVRTFINSRIGAKWLPRG